MTGIGTADVAWVAVVGLVPAHAARLIAVRAFFDSDSSIDTAGALLPFEMSSNDDSVPDRILTSCIFTWVLNSSPMGLLIAKG